ncbi:MAG: hypothetical protein ACLGJB_04080 [Blastocatellia bacterium]
MSVKTDNSLFMVSPLHAKFYQQLISTPVGFHELGTKLVRHAEHAYIFRKIERAEETARLLINVPIRQYQLIGQYYLGWCEYVRGADVKNTFEYIAEHAPLHYRARAMHTLAALAARENDNASELRWIIESMKASPLLEGMRGMAIFKAREGFHNSSITDLESCLPFARYSDPLSYYDYLNSYAVELGEAGRISEARNVIKHVLSSPLTHAYPEWQETAGKLKEPNRSLVTIPSIERKPLEVEIKETPHASTEAKPSKPARVVPFPPLKEAPEPKRPEIIDSQEFADMSLADKREFLLAAVRTELLPETEYNKMALMLGLVKSGPANHVIDLEDKKTLDDLMVEWAHLIEPEELVAVISALRDCEDDQRRVTIMDSMISRVFEYSRTRNITESEWRLNVERRLPEK